MVRVLFGAKPEALSVTVPPAVTGFGDSDSDGLELGWPPPDGGGLEGLGEGVGAPVVPVPGPCWNGPSVPPSPGVRVNVIPVSGSYSTNFVMIVVDCWMIVMLVVLNPSQVGPVYVGADSSVGGVSGFPQ